MSASTPNQKTTTGGYRKFNVGYEDELIGAYYGDTPEEACKACKDDMRMRNFTPDTPVRERLKGLIATPAN